MQVTCSIQCSSPHSSEMRQKSALRRKRSAADGMIGRRRGRLSAVGRSRRFEGYALLLTGLTAHRLRPPCRRDAPTSCQIKVNRRFHRATASQYRGHGTSCLNYKGDRLAKRCWAVERSRLRIMGTISTRPFTLSIGRIDGIILDTLTALAHGHAESHWIGRLWFKRSEVPFFSTAVKGPLRLSVTI